MQFSHLQPLWWLIPALLLLVVGFYFTLVDRPVKWKWLSFFMRVLAVLLLILALCKPFSKGTVDDMHVVFLVDTSASISSKGLAESIDHIEQGIAELGVSDSYSIVRFDKNTKGVNIEELRTLEKSIAKDGGEAQSRSASLLSSALLAARTQLRMDKSKKIVVFSDGVETSGSLNKALKTLSEEEVVVDFCEITSLEKVEAAVLDFDALVKTAFEGEIVRFEGTVAANNSMPATVRLLHRGVEVKRQSVNLVKDEVQKVGFEVEMFSAGNSRWTMELETEQDYFTMNNKVATTIQVSGKPRVLALHQKPKELRPLARLLKKQGIELDVRGANGLPESLAEMMAFQAILLCNVPATDLSINQLFNLKSYVVDLGGGLGMFGSENSFGIGGYYNTPVDEILPIASRYEKEKIKPSLAMALVIDKSGSMNGEPIALARQAAKSAVELLGTQDSIAVIGFDSKAQVIVPMSSAADKETIKGNIDSLAAGGGTNLYPGMLKAQEMLDVASAKIKHMIILSDGQTAGSGYEQLTEDLVLTGVTVSTVALGEGAAKDLMEALAALGKGRYYETNDAENVPQIFTKETMQASKSAIKEDLYAAIQVGDHPMLNGYEQVELPFIMGYVMTQSKATSKVLLATELGDPLLAVNRFGLGQTLSFTSDLTEKWGSEWLSWTSCGAFWNQILRAILRKEDGRGIVMKSEVLNDTLTMSITRKDDAGNLINQVGWNASLLDDKKNTESIICTQSGIGNYTAEVSLEGRERVMIQIRDKADGRMKTLYWQRPYPEEYQLQASPNPLLNEYVREDLKGIKKNQIVGTVTKDRVSWFALGAVLVALAGVFLRRV